MKATLIQAIGTLSVLLIVTTYHRVESSTVRTSCGTHGNFERWREDPNECGECVCEYGEISCQSCSEDDDSSGRIKTQDMSKPFPGCCPHYEEPAKQEFSAFAPVILEPATFDATPVAVRVEEEHAEVDVPQVMA